MAPIPRHRRPLPRQAVTALFGVWVVLLGVGTALGWMINPTPSGALFGAAIGWGIGVLIFAAVAGVWLSRPRNRGIPGTDGDR